MTPEIQIKRPLFQSTRSKYGARRFSHATAEEDSSFIEALAGCAGPDQIKDLRNQQVQRLQYADSISEESPVPQSNRHQEENPDSRAISPSPLNQTAKEVSIPPMPSRPGSLRRVFSWLQKSYTLGTTKQLRVSETVSLGEKRFVAILHEENRKFLIGGGASSVTLLTQLDAVNESVNSSASEPLPRSRGVY